VGEHLPFIRADHVLLEVLEDLTSDAGSTPDEPRYGLYRPPYESPIEDDFAWHFQKYLCGDLRFHAQFPSGPYRLDFAVSGARLPGTIAFECDGREFHDYFEDEERDREILERGKVLAIYRMRGTDIAYRINDLLSLIAWWDPALFPHRAHQTVRLLRSRDVVAAGYFDPHLAVVLYPLDASEEPPASPEQALTIRTKALYIERRTLDSMAPSTREVARRAFKVATELGDISNLLVRRSPVARHSTAIEL
jgi:very-short-patch-repair endonuclease